MPSSPPLQAQENNIIPFPSSLEVEFRLMLERTRNRSIFDQAKKATYRRWLKDPSGLVEGTTIEERHKDRNDRQSAINHFQLDQSCIYRKAEKHGDIMFQARYVALNSNALEII
jgi:hypothetical protein